MDNCSAWRNALDLESDKSFQRAVRSGMTPYERPVVRNCIRVEPRLRLILINIQTYLLNADGEDELSKGAAHEPRNARKT